MALAIVGLRWLDGCGGRTALESLSQDGAIARAGTAGSADDASDDSANGSAANDRRSSGACEAGGCASQPCTPMNVAGSNFIPNSDQPGPHGCHSGMILGWAWNGAQCVALVACSCAGSDCGRLFARRSTCLARYAHCLADGG
jgi:hypothetical protein